MGISGKLNIKRYRQIVTVFAKHGFGLLIDQIGLFSRLRMIRKHPGGADDAEHKLSTGVRLRLCLEELGPAFIKLGQILSTRADLFPAEVTDELRKLQDSVPPFPFDDVRAVIESEFEDKLGNIYKEFNETPIAAASISQVHFARLNSGKPVAVKVRRPGIENSFQVDLQILKDIAGLLDNHTKYGKFYDFKGMVLEFENTVKNELDFTKEAENADRFRANFKADEGVRVPEVKWIYTTKHILTMEFIEGMRINDLDALEQAGIDRNEMAKKLASSVCNQILRDGFFHADPHPGNLRVLQDGEIVFLDLGMVGCLSEPRKKIISDFFIGVATKDSKRIVNSILALDTTSEMNSRRKFEKSIDEIVDKYLTMPWNEIRIGELFVEIFNIAFMNHIRVPREFALISKTLVTLQGLLETIAPEVNSLEIAKPIARKLVYSSITAESIGKGIKRNFLNYRDFFDQFRRVMLKNLDKMEDGNFSFQMEVKNIENIQKRFDRAFDRISFSLILLAVSIIIAGIIIGAGLSASTGNEVYLLNVTVLKIGLVIAGIIIVGLIISMFRSDRH